MLILNMASGLFSMYYKLRGPNLATCSACATSTHAIGEALRTIKMGDAKVMFAGGTEATIVPLGIGGFCAMRALSTRNDEPRRSSRPFDLERDGFVMGEGAGVIALEELEHAKDRGAHIYCELAGYGNTADASHVTLRHRKGRRARCMQMALRSACLDPRDISTSMPTAPPRLRRPVRNPGHQENFRRARAQARGQFDQRRHRPHVRRCGGS
jgi:3-oxoacyl-[acyl-carrier-protein] synthase II